MILFWVYLRFILNFIKISNMVIGKDSFSGWIIWLFIVNYFIDYFLDYYVDRDLDWFIFDRIY